LCHFPSVRVEDGSADAGNTREEGRQLQWHLEVPNALNAFKIKVFKLIPFGLV
jgi:hypothetical protein